MQQEGIRVDDFLPASQDRVAEWLIRHDRAMDAIRAGNMEAAVALLRRRWVSLPGGSQQARGLSMREARRRFDFFVKDNQRR